MYFLRLLINFCARRVAILSASADALVIYHMKAKTSPAELTRTEKNCHFVTTSSNCRFSDNPGPFKYNFSSAILSVSAQKEARGCDWLQGFDEFVQVGGD